jgi:hypothetical protein
MGLYDENSVMISSEGNVMVNLQEPSTLIYSQLYPFGDTIKAEKAALSSHHALILCQHNQLYQLDFTNKREQIEIHNVELYTN